MIRVKRELSDGNWIQEFSTTKMAEALKVLDSLRRIEVNVRFEMFVDRPQVNHRHVHRRIKNTFICVCAACGSQIECYIRHDNFAKGE